MLNSVNSFDNVAQQKPIVNNNQDIKYKGRDFPLENDSVVFMHNKKIPTEKTHSGLITGIIAGLVIGGFNHLKFKLSGYKHSGIIGGLTLAGSMASGAAVDAITNKKRKEFVFINRGKTQKEVLLGNERAEVSRTGEIYYNTNAGKKFGTMLGAMIFPVIHLVRRQIQPKDIQKLSSPLQEYTKGMFRGAIGGFLMGAIADSCANKSAAKHADKVASVLYDYRNEQ